MPSSIDAICQIGMPTGELIPIVRRRFSAGEGPRVAIVAGVRGDTPEGVRVAHQVAAHLERHVEDLKGTVDLFPCVNPLAASRGVRRWPFFDQDLDRRFPGSPDGPAPDQAAHALVQAVRGADHVLELRGAHPSFSQAPQAMLKVGDEAAAALARHANVNAVWIREPGPAAGSTFAGQFAGSIALEGGAGNRLTAGVGLALAEGVLNLLNVLGVLPDDHLPFHWAAITRPVVVGDAQVRRVCAERAGLFMPEHDPWDEVQAGERLGTVVDPASGQVLEEVQAPAGGWLLAVRAQPVVFPGSLVARVVEKVDG